MFWSLIRKDLIRRWRSPASTLVMLLFPFMMAGMIGAISSGPSDQIPPTTLFVLDREDGLLGNFLAGGAVPEDSGFRLEVEKVGEEGFARMENGEASAMLVIPENFTEDLIEGRTTTLRLVRNPAESIKPEILEQGTHVIATYLDVAVKVLGEELEQMFDMFESDEMPTVLMVTQLSAAFYERISQAETYLFPPVVSIGSTKEEGAPRPNLFGYVLVMVSVMSVLFVAIRAVTDLYEDQRTGMLRRQLATPVPVAALVNAKVLFAVVFGVLVMLILLVAGALFGWFQEAVPVHWVLLHSVAFSLAAAGLMTVLVSVVRTEKQAGILAWIVVMAMSALGGSMFPAEILPEGVRNFSRLTLNYWAVEGYLDLIVRDGRLADVLPRTALLAGVGVVFAGVGQMLMQRRLREVVR